MKNKFAAAAILLFAIGMFMVIPGKKGLNPIQVMDNACKAENAFFETLGITHIVTEIKVFPLPEEYRKENILTKDTSIEEMTGADLWLKHNWMPTCSLKSDGQFRLNQLDISPMISEEYTITDQAWHDPETGYFKRIMENGNNIIMANAWDGREIYEMFNEDGKIKYIAENAAAGFNPPANPSEFLGLTAGLCEQIGKEKGFNCKFAGQETAADGHKDNIYIFGFVETSGSDNTYWQFNIDAITNCINEMAFYVASNKHISIRRTTIEKINIGPESWALLEPDSNNEVADSNISMNQDMYIGDVSVKHMVEKASYPTFTFKAMPAWCDKVEITDVADQPSPGHRMFIIDCYSESNNKHVLLVQAHTYNQMFINFLKDDVNGDAAYIKTDKYRIYHGGPQEKWWTKTVLDSCSITPEDDREGYLVWTSTETIPAMVVNGKTTKEELTAIVNNIITGEQYLEQSK